MAEAKRYSSEYAAEQYPAEHYAQPDAEVSYTDKDHYDGQYSEVTLEVLAAHDRERNLMRGLGQRHVSMIALAGAIGTGLFLSLGGQITTGGPAGALMGYIFIGLIVCSVMFALGEVTALVPVTGSFVRHAELLSDPAMGFALGWNIVYGNLLSVPSEIVAICVLFTFWENTANINQVAWIMIFIVLTALVGFMKIRWFGEVEFMLAVIKILLVVGVILMGLIIDLGGVKGTPRIGFRYWNDPGAFLPSVATGSWGNFLGFWSCLVSAVFSFSGVESISVAAAEVRNPRRAIPAACKRVFARVAIFYVLAVLIVGMIVPSNDPDLGNDSGTAATSPFVLVATRAGISAVPSIVNAVVITSAFSSSNQAMLAGTRILYGLSLKGHAPRFFLRTNSWGTPVFAVGLYILFSFLSFMGLSEGAMTVFWWFVDLVGCGVLISWSAILGNHIRLCYAFRIQGVDRRRLPWYNWWTPYASVAGLFFCIIILLTNGWYNFTKTDGVSNFTAAGFVTAYLDIALIGVLFTAWKLIRRTKWVRLAELPLEEILAAIEANPDEAEPASHGWIRIISWLWD